MATVVKMEDEKQLEVFNNALATFNVTEKVLRGLEDSTKLEIENAESEKVIRKFRQTAKSLQVNIDKRRRKLNWEYKQTTDEAARVLLDRVNPVYDSLNSKIKVIETEREAKKAEKERLEKERLEKIEKGFEDLTTTIAAGLQYNLRSDNIFVVLSKLNEYEISEAVFQERFQEASQILEKGIADVNIAYLARLKFEQEQIRQAEEAKKLAEEKAKLEADRKAAEAEAREKAKQEAEKRRLEEENLRAEREAIEKEKAEIEAKKQAEKEANELAIQKEKDWEAALIEAVEFDRARKEKLKADAERAKLVVEDKKIIEELIIQLNTLLDSVECPEFKTKKARLIVGECIYKLSDEIHRLKLAGQELV